MEKHLNSHKKNTLPLEIVFSFTYQNESGSFTFWRLGISASPETPKHYQQASQYAENRNYCRQKWSSAAAADLEWILPSNPTLHHQRASRIVVFSDQRIPAKPDFRETREIFERWDSHSLLSRTFSSESTNAPSPNVTVFNRGKSAGHLESKNTSQDQRSGVEIEGHAPHIADFDRFELWEVR